MHGEQGLIIYALNYAFINLGNDSVDEESIDTWGILLVIENNLDIVESRYPALNNISTIQYSRYEKRII